LSIFPFQAAVSPPQTFPSNNSPLLCRSWIFQNFEVLSVLQIPPPSDLFHVRPPSLIPQSLVNGRGIGEAPVFDPLLHAPAPAFRFFLFARLLAPPNLLDPLRSIALVRSPIFYPISSTHCRSKRHGDFFFFFPAITPCLPFGTLSDDRRCAGAMFLCWFFSSLPLFENPGRFTALICPPGPLAGLRVFFLRLLTRGGLY